MMKTLCTTSQPEVGAAASRSPERTEPAPSRQRTEPAPSRLLESVLASKCCAGTVLADVAKDHFGQLNIWLNCSLEPTEPAPSRTPESALASKFAALTSRRRTGCANFAKRSNSKSISFSDVSAANSLLLKQFSFCFTNSGKIMRLLIPASQKKKINTQKIHIYSDLTL